MFLQKYCCNNIIYSNLFQLRKNTVLKRFFSQQQSVLCNDNETMNLLFPNFKPRESPFQQKKKEQSNDGPSIFDPSSLLNKDEEAIFELIKEHAGPIDESFLKPLSDEEVQAEIDKMVQEMAKSPTFIKEKYRGVILPSDVIAKEIAEEVNQGTIGILKGGVAGGISIIHYEKTNDKFYSVVKVEPNSDTTYKVRIGKDYYLKTVKQNLVEFPNRLLAHAAAAEWEMQVDIIRPATLQITELMCRVQDVLADQITKNVMVKNLLAYFEAEHICHRETINQDHYMAPKIKEYWDPIVQWFQDTYGVSLKVFQNCGIPSDAEQTEAKKVFEKTILPTLLEHPYQLVIFHAMTEYLGSVITAWALFTKHINYEQAFTIVQLDRLEQTRKFGVVQGDHDVSFAELRSKVASCALFHEMIEDSQL